MVAREDAFHSSIHYQSITIRTSEGSTFHGKVNISTKERLSDLFTAESGPFLIMVDVISKDGQGKTLFLNKRHIVWAEPDEA